MAKPKPHAPDDKVALYERLVATNPKIERKGAANPYTSLNGHMFSLLTRGGTLILRLSAEDREAFIKEYRSKNPVQYGTVMKEYVEVPADLLNGTAELKKYFELSIEYVSSLKPKATKRSKV